MLPSLEFKLRVELLNLTLLVLNLECLGLQGVYQGKLSLVRCSLLPFQFVLEHQHVLSKTGSKLQQIQTFLVVQLLHLVVAQLQVQIFKRTELVPAKNAAFSLTADAGS